VIEEATRLNIALRRKEGWAYKDLARVHGIAVSTVWRICNPRVKVPKERPGMGLAKARQMRWLFHVAGWSTKNLVHTFKCSQTSVSMILNHQRWEAPREPWEIRNTRCTGKGRKRQQLQAKNPPIVHSVHGCENLDKETRSSILRRRKESPETYTVARLAGMFNVTEDTVRELIKCTSKPRRHRRGLAT